MIKLLRTAFALGLASLDVTGPHSSPSEPRALGHAFAPSWLADVSASSATVAFGTALSLIVGRANIGLVAAHSTWTLVSHIPLVLVLAFALSGENERIVTWVRTL